MVTKTMENKLVKVGVIGIGQQSTDNLIPAILTSSFANLSALCDIDEKVLRTASVRYNVQKIYTDLDDLVNDPNIEAIVVASHPEVHFLAAKKAIEAGKHVFIEKPPVENTKQLSELLTLHKKHPLVTTGVGMNFGFTEMSGALSQVIWDKQYFGDITRIEINHHSSKPRTPLWGYKSIVDSFLLAQLIHPLHQMLEIGGKVSEVSFRSSIHNTPIFVDVILDFANGITGVLKCSTYYPYFEHRVEVYGSNGLIATIDNINQMKVVAEVERKNYFGKAPSLNFNNSPLSSSAKNAGFSNELDDFFNAILRGLNFKNNLESMVPTYEVISFLSSELNRKYST
jgi:phthalate 4,5-cis-dihydrodiol dehydrogenase